MEPETGFENWFVLFAGTHSGMPWHAPTVITNIPCMWLGITTNASK